MTRRIFGRTINVGSAAMVAAILWGTSYLGHSAFAQTEPKQPAKDYLQRSLEIYEFRKAAPSGAERGQEIFYYKCWFCHNEYVKDIQQLKDLFQKANLASGLYVNDANVKDRLRNGGPNMPAYARSLTPEEIQALVAFLATRR